MKCPKCGTDVLSTDSHCSSCGVHLATAFSERRSSPRTAQPQASTPAKTSFEKQQGTQPTNVTQSNEKAGDSFYQFFLSLPDIFAVLVAIAGIVLSIAIEEWWFFPVGLIAAVVIWFISRVSIAPIVTAINYLRAIEENTRKK